MDPSVELSTHYRRFVFQMFTFVNNVAADPIKQYTKSDPQSSPPATPKPSEEMVRDKNQCFFGIRITLILKCLSFMNIFLNLEALWSLLGLHPL